jgi:hypothetical protein
MAGRQSEERRRSPMLRELLCGAEGEHRYAGLTAGAQDFVFMEAEPLSAVDPARRESQDLAVGATGASPRSHTTSLIQFIFGHSTAMKRHWRLERERRMVRSSRPKFVSIILGIRQCDLFVVPPDKWLLMARQPVSVPGMIVKCSALSKI